MGVDDLVVGMPVLFWKIATRIDLASQKGAQAFFFCSVQVDRGKAAVLRGGELSGVQAQTTDEGHDYPTVHGRRQRA
jgi:hypothetical protein